MQAFLLNRIFMRPSIHGKSVCDALGAIAKQSGGLDVLRRKVLIRDAEEFYNYCAQNLTVQNKQKTNYDRRVEVSKREYIFVSKNDIQHERDANQAKTVNGNRMLHVDGAGKLRIRKLSCLCEGCRKLMQCRNISCLGPWETKTLATSQAKEPITVDRTSASNSDLGNHEASTLTATATQQQPLHVATGTWVAVFYDDQWYPDVVRSH